jgi:hypothetical protein
MKVTTARLIASLSIAVPGACADNTTEQQITINVMAFVHAS